MFGQFVLQKSSFYYEVLMKVKKDTVCFNKYDMSFVKKFGFFKATEMVLDYSSINKTPFIYDTYQLSHFLRMGRKSLFSIINNCDNCYNRITIKKSNGKNRVLHSPKLTLKAIQKIILNKILYKIPISKYATAYHKGAKLIDNANPHSNKKYLLKMDLSNFFDSITFMQVYSSAFNTKRYPKQIGAILTTLCCREDVLPQGAPTSPALSNIVMKSFDDYFGKWCEERNFSYTRYCDDITVSGDSSVYSAFIKAKTMLENMGFEINKKKTHFITNTNRQTVTGLVVNERARIPSDYRRKLRQEVYYISKYGIKDAFKHLKDNQYNSIYNYYNSLVGRINYVLQIEPENQQMHELKDDLKRNVSCLQMF